MLLITVDTLRPGYHLHNPFTGQASCRSELEKYSIVVTINIRYG
jgi:hypothetical protein